jgi:hypothetical protein
MRIRDSIFKSAKLSYLELTLPVVHLGNIDFNIIDVSAKYKFIDILYDG